MEVLSNLKWIWREVDYPRRPVKIGGRGSDKARPPVWPSPKRGYPLHHNGSKSLQQELRLLTWRVCYCTLSNIGQGGQSLTYHSFRPRLAGTEENKGEFVLLHMGTNATLLCIYAWQVKRLRVCTGHQEYNKSLTGVILCVIIIIYDAYLQAHFYLI